jgi:hypothetical protein
MAIVRQPLRKYRLSRIRLKRCPPMNDYLQIATIIIAILALSVSKKNIQKALSNLDETQKKYYNSIFFKFRIFQYPVLFFTIASGMYISGTHPQMEYAWFLFSISCFAALIWFIHTIYYIHLQKKSKILPDIFLNSFLQDRILLFILISILLFNAFLKLQSYHNMI